MSRIDTSSLPFGKKPRKKSGIDYSALANPKQGRVDDPAYRRSAKDRTCAASDNGVDLCGLPTVLAHIREGEYAGVARKPSDDTSDFLCDKHHRDQEAHPGSEWWFENIYKPSRRRAYRRWKSGQFQELI